MKEKLIFMLVIIVLGYMVYVRAEMQEEHAHFVKAAQDFMGQGDRFTKQRGDAMEIRLMAVEQRQEVIIQLLGGDDGNKKNN